MKKAIVTLLVLIVSTIALAQSRFEATDTTSKLPEGVYVNYGKLMLKNGYTTKVSKNKKVMMVMAPGGTNLTGAFFCNCSQNNIGECSVKTDGINVACEGNCRCRINIMTAGNYNNIPLNPELEPSPETGWKILIISTLKNQ